jgi:BclA C-terminal domain
MEIKMGIRRVCAFAQFELFSDTTIAGEGGGISSRIPFNLATENEGFTQDTVNRSIIASVPGVYLVIFNLYVQGVANQGAAYSIRLNGSEEYFFGFEPNLGRNRLVGQGILRLNAGDAVQITNTGNTADTLVTSADGQQTAAASLTLAKICEFPF